MAAAAAPLGIVNQLAPTLTQRRNRVSNHFSPVYVLKRSVYRYIHGHTAALTARRSICVNFIQGCFTTRERHTIELINSREQRNAQF